MYDDEYPRVRVVECSKCMTAVTWGARLSITAYHMAHTLSELATGTEGLADAHCELSGPKAEAAEGRPAQLVRRSCAGGPRRHHLCQGLARSLDPVALLKRTIQTAEPFQSRPQSSNRINLRIVSD